MPKKTRKRFTSQEKVAILRLHLLEHTPVSDLCDQHGIHPTMFYRWQKEFFENAAAAFEPRDRQAGDAKDRRITLLEQKLQRKNEVLSELMEEHIKLKKELGCVGSAGMGQTGLLDKLEAGNKNCKWIYRSRANPGRPWGGIVPPSPVLAP